MRCGCHQTAVLPGKSRSARPSTPKKKTPTRAIAAGMTPSIHRSAPATTPAPAAAHRNCHGTGRRITLVKPAREIIAPTRMRSCVPRLRVPKPSSPNANTDDPRTTGPAGKLRLALHPSRCPRAHWFPKIGSRRWSCSRQRWKSHSARSFGGSSFDQSQIGWNNSPPA